MQFNPRYLSRVLTVLLLLVIGAAAQSDLPTLEIGKSVERELKGGEAHSYNLSIQSGHYIDVAVQQRGIDVVVTLLAPDGTKAYEIDSPNGTRGTEPVQRVVSVGGEYRVEIKSLEQKAAPGKYEIKLNERRVATDDDVHFVAARDKVLEALALARTDKTKVVQTVADGAGLFRRIADPKRKADGLIQLADVLRRSKQAADAVLLFDEATEIYLLAGMKSEAARYINEAAKLAPTNSEKEAKFLRAVAIFESIGDYKLTVGRILDVGIGSFNAGDYNGAVEKFKEGYAIAQQRGVTNSMVAALDNLGAAYTYQNDFAKALESHQRAMEIDAGDRPNIVADRLLNIGNVYHGIGEYELALANFRSALERFEKLKQPVGIAYATSNIGSTYLEMAQYDKALEYFLRAQPMKAKFMPDDPTSFNNIAAVYRAQGRFAEAREHVIKGLELCGKVGDSECRAIALIEMSTLDLATGDVQSALQNANAATTLSRKNEYPEHLADSLLLTAQAQIRLSKLKEAEAALTESIAIVERVANNLIGSESTGAAFFEMMSERYALLADLLIKAERPDAALAIAERMKARALLSTLSNGSKDTTKSMSQAEKVGEKKLRLELVELAGELSEEKDPVKRGSLSEQLARKRIEFEELRIRLYASHPELRVQRGEMNTVTLAETAPLLSDKNSAIVEFIVSEKNTFLFVVTRDAGGKPLLKVLTVDANLKNLAPMIDRFRKSLASGGLDFAEASKGLYDLLLKPAAADLKAKSNIIIVPDGVLWALPFQALMDANGQYLIEKASVSYAPSLTALTAMRKKNATRTRTAGAELLAFGNPIVGKDTAARVQRVFMSEKLEPLPEADRLVNTLSTMYGPDRSKVLTGKAAREETVKREAPKYRIVQFATHGILNNTSPMYSHLVLAQDDKNPNEDGLLEAWELKDLDLNADMVILSACDTARGKVSGGEGVIGMTWAAFIAGAPTTVASLWKVESSSTTEFMLEFHRQLLANKKISKAEAMRRASLKLMRSAKYRHPSYWAPWVLVGDGS